MTLFRQTSPTFLHRNVTGTLTLVLNDDKIEKDLTGNFSYSEAYLQICNGRKVFNQTDFFQVIWEESDNIKSSSHNFSKLDGTLTLVDSTGKAIKIIKGNFSCIESKNEDNKTNFLGITLNT